MVSFIAQKVCEASLEKMSSVIFSHSSLMLSAVHNGLFTTVLVVRRHISL